MSDDRIKIGVIVFRIPWTEESRERYSAGEENCDNCRCSLEEKTHVEMFVKPSDDDKVGTPLFLCSAGCRDQVVDAFRRRRATLKYRSTRAAWHEIEPVNATEIQLPSEHVWGPLTQEGKVCPWPWEPQQLVGVPLGQYHCGYCGEMVIAGVAHTDYIDE